MTRVGPSIAMVVNPNGGLGHYAMHLWRPLSRHAGLRWSAPANEPTAEPLALHGIEVSPDLDPAFGPSSRRAAEALRTAAVEVVNLHVGTQVVADIAYYTRFLEECRRARLGVALTLHNVRPHSVSRYDSCALRAFYELGEAFVVGTRQEEQRLREGFALDGRPVAVARMGPFTLLDRRRVDRKMARQRLGLPAEAPVALFFGSYRHEKGLEVLIEAFPRVQAARRDACLIVSTSARFNPDGASALAAIRAAASSRPRWTFGDMFVPEPQIEVLFRAADVVVLPYRHVSQSAVRALAAAFARAVVLTDAFEDGPDVDGLWGRCVPSEDPVALAAALLDVFARPRLERDGRGRAGYERAMRLESWDANAAQVASLCQRVLAPRRGVPPEPPRQISA